VFLTLKRLNKKDIYIYIYTYIYVNILGIDHSINIKIHLTFILES